MMGMSAKGQKDKQRRNMKDLLLCRTQERREREGERGREEEEGKRTEE